MTVKLFSSILGIASFKGSVLATGARWANGTAPVMNDLLGNHVPIAFGVLPPALGNLQSGTLRAIAVLGPTRFSLLPDVPTADESGLPGFESVLHYGLLAPAGTPQPVIAKLNAEINKVLARPDVKEAWAKQGAVPIVMSPSEFDTYMRGDIEKWAKVIQTAGIKVQ